MENKNKNVWGWHLSIDASGCNSLIDDYDSIYKFTKELVEAIDMVAYGEPQIINFGSDDKAGYTMVQLIETSNICAHFTPSLKAVFFDVFSCKPFLVSVVCSLLQKYFDPSDMKTHYIERTCER